MISKIVDGCFFFLIFKICQYLWDTLSPIGGKVCSNGLTLVPNGTRVEALELLANRFDHFEDLLFRYLEAEK